MKSITKNHLSDEKIRELVKLHFGADCETGEIRELTGGFFNAVYLVERKKQRDKIVLKVGVIPGTPLLTYEQDIMPTEVAAMELIREQTTVPVPKILAYDFSKQHIRSNYFFMTAMEGQTLSSISRKLDQEQTDRLRRELAGYLAQIHTIRGPYFGYFSEDENRQYKTWKEAFYAMFEMVLTDAKKLGRKLPYERIRRVLRENGDVLETQKVPALVNYDCHEGNIFVKQEADGYHIEGIVDLERAYWGDPIADFPAAFVMGDDIRKEKAFLEEYLEQSAEIKAYTETELRRYLLYRMYLMTIMAAETFRFGFLYAHLQGGLAKHGVMKCLKELEKYEA